MDEAFTRFPSLFGRWPQLSGDGEKSVEWSPSVDISETAEEYLIRAALPAVRKEDVIITVDDGMLTLKGERLQKEEQKNERFHKVETFYGTFSRSFSLPEATDANEFARSRRTGY